MAILDQSLIIATEFNPGNAGWNVGPDAIDMKAAMDFFDGAPMAMFIRCTASGTGPATHYRFELRSSLVNVAATNLAALTGGLEYAVPIVASTGDLQRAAPTGWVAGVTHYAAVGALGYDRSPVLPRYLFPAVYVTGGTTGLGVTMGLMLSSQVNRKLTVYPAGTST